MLALRASARFSRERIILIEARAALGRTVASESANRLTPTSAHPEQGRAFGGLRIPGDPRPCCADPTPLTCPPTGVLCAAVLCDPRPANLQAAPCMLCAAPDRHTSTLRAWGRLWGPASCRALARSQPPIRTGAAHQLCGKSPDRALGSRMARTLAA